MKRILFVLFFVMIGVMWAQESVSLGISTSESNTVNEKSDEQVAQIIENLNVIQYSYLKKLKTADYKQAVILIDEIKQLIEANQESTVTETNTSVVVQETSNQNVNINMNISGITSPVDNVTTVQTIEAPSEKRAMDSSSFMRLVDNIRSESFSDDQLRYIRTASRNHYFSVNQIGQLIDLFDFSEEKIDCLRITYVRVVDDENGFDLINKFIYDADKEAAEEIINQ